MVCTTHRAMRDQIRRLTDDVPMVMRDGSAKPMSPTYETW